MVSLVHVPNNCETVTASSGRVYHVCQCGLGMYSCDKCGNLICPRTVIVKMNGEHCPRCDDQLTEFIDPLEPHEIETAQKSVNARGVV